MLLRLLAQLAPFALLAGGTSICVAIFISLKKELHGLTHRVKEQQREIDNLEQRLTAQVNEMRASLHDIEENSGVLVPPTPPRSGFNLSKRSQAMRMSRRGEDPINIAAALSVPRKEVELLLKVQKIILSTVETSTA